MLLIRFLLLSLEVVLKDSNGIAVSCESYTFYTSFHEDLLFRYSLVKAVATRLTLV
jgi:hypothetical protein